MNGKSYDRSGIFWKCNLKRNYSYVNYEFMIYRNYLNEMQVLSGVIRIVIKI